MFIACVIDVFTVEEDAPHAEYDYILDILKTYPGAKRFWHKQQTLMQVMIPEYVNELNRRLETE